MIPEEFKKALDPTRPALVVFSMGTTFKCSRSATNPLKFYWLMKAKGVKGFTAQAKDLLDNAAYLKAKLDEIGWPAWISCEQSNTVFFEKPSDATMKKYFLAPDYDERFGGDLAHVTVMQNASRDLIDRLVVDLQAELKASSEDVKKAA